MKEKVLLILGASSETGIAYLNQYQEKYNHIFAHYYTSKDELFGLEKRLGNRMTIFQGDFSEEDDIHGIINAIRKEGKMPTHILHLPSDKYLPEKFKKTSWIDIEKGMEISVKSIYLFLQAFLPVMAKEKKGKVVVLLSSCTKELSPRYLTVYNTVKHALLGLVKSLATEFSEKSICVNAVSPSMMETRLLSEVPDLIIQKNAAENPRGKNITTKEVIPTIDFLLSEESDFITGQNIFITGGQ